MDPNDLFWDEDLTSDLEWAFVAPVPTTSSMSPVRPRAPSQPFVTVQDLQHGRPIPEFDHSIPDSLIPISTKRSDPLPVPAHVPSIPSSLKHDPLPSHQSKVGSSERPPSESKVQPPTPAFHVVSTKRPQSESQPIQPKRNSRRADLLSVRQPSSNPTLVQMFVSLLSVLGESSTVYMDLHTSPNFAEHAGRLLDNLQPAQY